MRTPYAVTEDGIAIIDGRQKSNGAIVPNYVIDLYLPIIGFEGIGVYATIARIASLTRSGGVATGVKTLAFAGRKGDVSFAKLLALMERLGLVSIRRPEGSERMNHVPTRIELLDAPDTVPSFYMEEVLKRSVNRDFINNTTGEIEHQEAQEVGLDNSAESLFRDSAESLNRDSMESLNRDSILMGNHGNHNTRAINCAPREPDSQPETNGVKRRPGRPKRTRTPMEEAVAAGWKQLDEEQAEQGAKRPATPQGKSGWIVFWTESRKIAAFAEDQGWDEAQLRQHIKACFRYYIKEQREFWQGKPFTLTSLVKLLPSWWDDIGRKQQANPSHAAAQRKQEMLDRLARQPVRKRTLVPKTQHSLFSDEPECDTMQ